MLYSLLWRDSHAMPVIYGELIVQRINERDLNEGDFKEGAVEDLYERDEEFLEFPV